VTIETKPPEKFHKKRFIVIFTVICVIVGVVVTYAHYSSKLEPSPKPEFLPPEERWEITTEGGGYLNDFETRLTLKYLGENRAEHVSLTTYTFYGYVVEDLGFFEKGDTVNIERLAYVDRVRIWWKLSDGSSCETGVFNIR